MDTWDFNISIFPRVVCFLTKYVPSRSVLMHMHSKNGKVCNKNIWSFGHSGQVKHCIAVQRGDNKCSHISIISSTSPWWLNAMITIANADNKWILATYDVLIFKSGAVKTVMRDFLYAKLANIEWHCMYTYLIISRRYNRIDLEHSFIQCLF